MSAYTVLKPYRIGGGLTATPGKGGIVGIEEVNLDAGLFITGAAFGRS